MEISGQECKTATYADDIFLFLTKPLITLPNLPQEIKTFGKLSSAKYHSLHITLSQELMLQWQNNFPFTWKLDVIAYLGIQLPSILNDLYAYNYLTLLI